MAKLSYYVNKNAQSTGEHEVHHEKCAVLPEGKNMEYLGQFDTCQEALKEARKRYSNVDGCKYCSYECHRK